MRPSGQATLSTNAEAVNYAVGGRDLKYYIFDWDDNILHMPTLIHLERKTEKDEWVPHSVSTAVFSVIRSDTEHYRPPQGNWEQAFRDFRDIDVQDENIFLRDTRRAVDRVVGQGEAPPPSFLKLRQTLIDGRLFAILTARGHAPEVIKQGVRYFVDTILSESDRQDMLRNLRGYLACYEPGHNLSTDDAVIDYYLALNRYYGVMSRHFRDLMKRHEWEAVNTEDGKQFAIRDFVHYVVSILRKCGVHKPISVGFSDDDERNARSVEAYIRAELGQEFPSMKFVVYYTSDPDVPSGRKVEVRGQLNLRL